MSNPKDLKQKLIRISSRDREDKTSGTSTFSITYDNETDLQKVYSVIVKHVSFTNTFYNMKFPETIEYKYQSGTYVHVIPADVQWTIYELLDWVNSEGAWSASHNWTYDPTLNKVLVITDSLTNLQILGGVVCEKLGLEPQTTAQTSNFYGQNQVNLAGIQHVFVHSPQCTNGTNMIKGGVNTKAMDCLIMVPNDVPFGSVKHYETNHSDLDVVNFGASINLQRITVSLKDGAGNLLDTSNHEVDIILKVLFY
jgi:hypothetical protein